ncbi:DUF1189 family protein, partial [Mammaliicoccus sciuri]
ILIIPNSIQYIQITQNLSTLVNDEVTEIPDFEIDQNKMILSQDKSIKLNHHQTVEFTKSNDFEMKDHHLIVFKPNHIEISNYSDYTEISYGSLSSLVTDQDDLIKFIETINDSKYFYLSLIVVFLLFFQFLSLSIKIGILAFAGHLLGMILRRKSRFMTWFKMMTFVITLPTLVLLLGMITVIPLLIIASWCIIILSIVMIAMYLP